jgi:hypothetical protein
MTARRFPPPWSIEEMAACFIVRDRDSQALAYVYYEDEPGRRTTAKLLSKDEAWPIAANIAGAFRRSRNDAHARLERPFFPELPKTTPGNSRRLGAHHALRRPVRDPWCQSCLPRTRTSRPCVGRSQKSPDAHIS